MKVEKHGDSLIIVPETEMEEQFLCEMYPYGHSFTAYIKTGVTASDLIGLKINPKCLKEKKKKK